MLFYHSTTAAMVAASAILLHISTVECQSATSTLGLSYTVFPSSTISPPTAELSPTFYGAVTAASSRLYSSSAEVSPTTTIVDETFMISSTFSGYLSPTPSPHLSPVFEPSVPTYGNNICEGFYAGGVCSAVLAPFPEVLTNLSRSAQTEAIGAVNNIVGALEGFMAQEHCFQAALPLLCRYSFPTCDPAYHNATYQPICRRDCEIVRDFLCREPWRAMVKLINILDFDYLDEPNCEPLRNTEAGDSPMCISTLNKDYIPAPLLTGPDCYSGRGRGYQGTVNRTISGRTCQSWSTSYPHQHLMAYESYTELAGGHNYCRNPGERGQRPWCFTTDRNTRWEYCNITKCASRPSCVSHFTDVCRTSGTIGKDWIYLDSSMTNEDTLANSTRELLNAIAQQEYSQACTAILVEYICVSKFPSCDLSHTTPRSIPVCGSFCNRVHKVCGDQIRNLLSFSSILNDKINLECNQFPVPNGGDAPECYDQLLNMTVGSYTTECYNKSDLGVSYRGDVAVTASGKTCQSWVSQSPHPHSITPLDRPELEGHNKCRNPDGRGLSPWCYTTDINTRWEYCDIPACNSNAPNIPTYAYIIIGVGSFILLLIFLFLLIVCCYKSCNKSRKKPQFDEVNGKEDSVKLTSIHMSKLDITNNPLYARNPLKQQQSMEYDGLKLPEFPRERIFYIRDLGQGHFGVVVQAEAAAIEPSREKSQVAIKVMKEGASSQVKKEFFREASLMNTFDHPNILRLLGVCIRQEPFCMIFEYMELGDLNHFLRQNSPHKWSGSTPSLNKSISSNKVVLSTQQLVCIAVDIAAGLDYMAQNHFVHCDLATRNCLVSRNLHVKISDFGLSQDVYLTDYFKMGDSEILPIRWMPPEAILYAKFTTQSDVWSFGVVLWEIFSYGIQPYFSLSNEEVVQHVRDGNIMNSPEGCPKEIYDVMVDCWVMEPSERPNAGELCAGLQRWSPDLSATLQNQNQTDTVIDYQNMAVVKAYAQKSLSEEWMVEEVKHEEKMEISAE